MVVIRKDARIIIFGGKLEIKFSLPCNGQHGLSMVGSVRVKKTIHIVYSLLEPYKYSKFYGKQVLRHLVHRGNAVICLFIKKFDF